MQKIIMPCCQMKLFPYSCVFIYHSTTEYEMPTVQEDSRL